MLLNALFLAITRYLQIRTSAEALDPMVFVAVLKGKAYIIKYNSHNNMYIINIVHAVI